MSLYRRLYYALTMTHETGIDWIDKNVEPGPKKWAEKRKIVIVLACIMSALLFVLSGADDLLGTGAAEAAPYLAAGLDMLPVKVVHSWVALLPLALGLVYCTFSLFAMDYLAFGFARRTPFASKSAIHEMRLDPKESGVVLGVNPHTGKVMMSNDDSHVLVVGPTRAGKSVNTVVPTAFAWNKNAFFLDLKGEIYKQTSDYRRKVLHQKVLRYEPLSATGSTVSWNPFKVVRFGTEFELMDLQSIAEAMVVDVDAKTDPYWHQSARNLLVSLILHAHYKNIAEGRNKVVDIADVVALAWPGCNYNDFLNEVSDYPHLTLDEFLEPVNKFEKVYGEYVREFNDFNEVIEDDFKLKITSMKELKTFIKEHKEWYKDHLEKAGSYDKGAYTYFLCHPRVRDITKELKDLAETTRSCIFSSLQAEIVLYRNPIVQQNMRDTDFDFVELMTDGDKKVTLYLVVPPKDMPVLRPFLNFFVEYMLRQILQNGLLNENEYISAPSRIDVMLGRQPATWREPRLLVLLDDFTQLGKICVLEDFITICAGYGIKLCLITQDLFQIARSYGKENCISSNCNINMYFTPNIDLGMQTAKTLADVTGISAYSVSKMPNHLAMVFTQGQKPIGAYKITHDEHAFFGFIDGNVNAQEAL